VSQAIRSSIRDSASRVIYSVVLMVVPSKKTAAGPATEAMQTGGGNSTGRVFYAPADLTAPRGSIWQAPKSK